MAFSVFDMKRTIHTRDLEIARLKGENAALRAALEVHAARLILASQNLAEALAHATRLQADIRTAQAEHF